MNRLLSYFRGIGPRRLIGLVVGNLVLGIGCGFFKWSVMGNDPFSACGMALSDLTGIPYGPFVILYNIFFFIFTIIWGRKYIGIGTILNWFGLGYFTQGTYDILTSAFGSPQGLLLKLLVMVIGVLIASLGIALYQTSDTGIAPYDTISLMMNEYWHWPYFWCRMFTDCICAAVCFIAGGLLGPGTLVSAFGLGPFVHMFTVFFAEKVLRHKVTAS